MFGCQILLLEALSNKTDYDTYQATCLASKAVPTSELQKRCRGREVFGSSRRFSGMWSGVQSGIGSREGRGCRGGGVPDTYTQLYHILNDIPFLLMPWNLHNF
jgi:hypothetical protein